MSTTALSSAETHEDAWIKRLERGEVKRIHGFHGNLERKIKKEQEEKNPKWVWNCPEMALNLENKHPAAVLKPHGEIW